MSLIKCPECNREISDKATTCPNCGCPIETEFGGVKIKLCNVNVKLGVNGKQKVTIKLNNESKKILWEGNVGSLVELYFEKPTEIEIEYHLNLMHYGGKCTGVIDPKKSKKYCVFANQGFMKSKLDLQPVDLFEAE